MKHIKAVMLCTLVQEAGGAKKATLEPVPSVQPEDPNYGWSQTAKPEAKFELTVSNQSAHSFFQQGTKYEVDFKPMSGNVTTP